MKSDTDTAVEPVEVTADVVSDVALVGEVPALAGMQRQGDVFVLPAKYAPATTTTGPTRDVHPSVDVVDGGTARHNHTLVADPGAASWTPARDEAGLAIGILTVETGATAYMSHDEHSMLGIAPGGYVISRQREQAQQQRLVAD